MFISQQSTLIRLTLAAAVGTTLAACGGTAIDEQSATLSSSAARSISAASNATAASTTYALESRGTTQSTPSTTAPPPAGTGITDVRLENFGTVAENNVPLTFGQVFATGHLKTTESLVGRLDNGTAVPLQIDVKATHADGSVRHAVISGVVASLKAGEVRTLSLIKQASVQATSATTASVLSANGLTTTFNATIGGVRYSASVAELIKNTSKVSTWMSGPVASEWHVSAPLTTASGAAHPHLTARFAIRWYHALKQARVDVTIENNWAYEPAPQNFTYDAQVMVQGAVAYSKPAMTHYHHARWRKVFWTDGTEPTINIKHNTGYLLDTRALPNYDRTISVPETTLAAYKARWTAAASAPMAVGLALAYMPSPGGREDIGFLPGWGATYLLSMDKRAKEVTLGTADLAGSWSSHYRDKNTDRPISLIDYPYMTILGRPTDTVNPVTKKPEAFPLCATTPANACSSPYNHDTSHQPAFAYLPYLVTGDYYYLEELQFWAMWSAFSSNPGYRGYVKGLVNRDQVRAQAWTLRTVGEAAYISPDTDRLKKHFASIVKSNVEWYDAQYTNNPSSSPLGIITYASAAAYNNFTGVGPWMDDFVTAAMGHLVDLGFTEAMPFLKWKAKFPVARMTAPGACWVDGAQYVMKVRDGENLPFYTTMAQVYAASHTADFLKLGCGSVEMAASLKLKAGEMTGYSGSPMGYPSNMQPALAYAADYLGAPGLQAWTVFDKRTVKPNYGTGPQFAIVPRSIK